MNERKKRAADPQLEALRQKIRELMDNVSDDMITGGCQDYSHYTHKVGTIQGLALAERELLDLDDLLLKQ